MCEKIIGERKKFVFINCVAVRAPVSLKSHIITIGIPSINNCQTGELIWNKSNCLIKLI